MRSAAILRSLARFAAQPAKIAAMRNVQFRTVTTSHKALSSVSTQLADCLNQEIKAEKEMEAQNIAAPTFPGYNVTQKEAEVRLTKQHGNESILVVFNVNHSVDMDEEFEGEMMTESAPVPVALPPFTVEITKGNERLCFHLELCETEQAGEYDFRVDEFYVAPSATADGKDEEVAGHVYASSGKYIDANLHDLLFVRYLEERGLDTAFCKNLVAYATHYEHSQYVSLLHKIKAFVSK